LLINCWQLLFLSRIINSNYQQLNSNYQQLILIADQLLAIAVFVCNYRFLSTI